MRPLAEQTHYEVLEIEPQASAEDVERAYRMARATYAGESLATYSIFGDQDSEAIRQRLEMAYEVLSDAVARQRYDADLARDREGPVRPGPADRFGLVVTRLDPDEIEPLFLPASPEPEPGATLVGPYDEPGEGAGPRIRAEVPSQLSGLEDVDDESDLGVYDGGRLRRARLRRGVEIEQIASITKVNPAYLRFIEEDRYDGLPAAVYVRGFVAAYARCLGLRSEAVAASYMELFREARSEPTRARGRA